MKTTSALKLIPSPQPSDYDAPIMYDSPQGCQCIVAVGEDGGYLFLKSPRLWCFEIEPAPQDCGFGDSFDLPIGVYSMTFDFRSYVNRDTGHIDDWEFELSESTLLWSYTKN